MTSPSDHGGPVSSPPAGAGGQLPVGRAAALLILFIIIAAVLLGQVHPAKPVASAASSTASTSTSTTVPAAPTTTTAAPTPPAQVAVLSANGSSVAQAATTLANQLRAIGWNTLPPVNATSQVPSTTVYYAPGFQPSATTIADMLGLAASVVQPIGTSVPVSSAAGGDVIVVLGPNAAGKTITTTASATSTTAARKAG
jgi:hypothetical protein